MPPKLHKLKAVLAAALVVLIPPAWAVAPEHPAAIYREGEALVQFRSGASAAEMQAAKARLGLVAKRGIAGSPRLTELVRLPGFTTTAAALDALRADPAVERAEPNFLRFARAVVPDDPLFDDQWGVLNTGQDNFVDPSLPSVPGADLNLTEAWDEDGDGVADRTGTASVILAIIDDAFQTAHPDLAPNMIQGHNFFSCQDANDPNPVTPSGAHGTLVAGAAAARGNNGVGVAGAAWNVSLMPLKFTFDAGTHMDALEYARDNGAKIVNASFGGPGFSQIEQDFIAGLAANDMLYVAAGGNDDSNTDLGQLNFPANYAADNIVAVAATNRQDNIAGFSQYGPLSIDVAAPGLQIVTTRIGSSYQGPPGVSGTSFSSPYTAGIAALLKSHVAPQPGFMEMKARLIESGTVAGGGNAKLKTVGGRVDADAALDMAPRPALVITAMSFADGGNNVPDPGETLDLTFTVRNLWQAATGVTATLTADNGVTVNTGVQALNAMAALESKPVTFSITIPAGVTEHRYVSFTLSLAADGGYAAARSAGTEIGTLTPGNAVVQAFEGFDDNPYDEFHAWHVDVPSAAGKTLFIRTSTTNGEDIDLLVKRDTPPQYTITVGINPEVTSGLFCTSGTTVTCVDPNTLVSARLDGVESVSVVNPQASTYHIVVVNFDQVAVPYTIRAELLDGDLRPDPFFFFDATGIAANRTVVSNEVIITDISGPSPITVVGGEYNINGGSYTTQAGFVQPNQRVRLRTDSGSGAQARVQVTIGGVTDTFSVNPTAPPGFGGGENTCGFGGIGGGGGGGRLPVPALAGLLLAALARRCLRRA